MHERVIDRSAAHALPHELRTRDWLLVALAFASGIIEAICFFSFGKVFAGFQTGNIVLLGVIAAGTRPPLGPQPTVVPVSLGAFAVGAAVAMPILKSFNGDNEVSDDQVRVFEVWPRRVSAALLVTLAAQLGFLAVWIANSPSPSLPSQCILIGLAAFAMGIQMNAVRLLHVPAISTTAATATFISLVSGAVTWSLKAPAARVQAAVLVGIAAGACYGDSMLRYAHAYAPVLPAIVVAAVIAVASVLLRQARLRGSSSPRPSSCQHAGSST
jgi:uncharacterized membrane protein YoaK (UPF0700 family)